METMEWPTSAKKWELCKTHILFNVMHLLKCIYVICWEAIIIYSFSFHYISTTHNLSVLVFHRSLFITTESFTGKSINRQTHRLCTYLLFYIDTLQWWANRTFFEPFIQNSKLHEWHKHDWNKQILTFVDIGYVSKLVYAVMFESVSQESLD